MKLRKILMILLVMFLLPFPILAEEEINNEVVTSSETLTTTYEDKTEDEVLVENTPIPNDEHPENIENFDAGVEMPTTSYRVDKPQSTGVLIYLIVVVVILLGMIILFFAFLYHIFTVYRKIKMVNSKSSKVRIQRQS